MPSINDPGVFQGVRVTPDGIIGLKANDTGDGTFTPYKRNPDGTYTPTNTGPVSMGGTPTKMYDREGNEYDPKTGKPIDKESPFDKGPQNIYDDKPKTEQQKAIADYQANRQKQLDDFLKINADIFQRSIQSSTQFHQNTLSQLQSMTQAAQS